MGIRILVGTEGGNRDGREVAVLFCSVTETALAPMFDQGPEPNRADAGEVAQAFLAWLGTDPREVDDLGAKKDEFVARLDFESAEIAAGTRRHVRDSDCLVGAVNGDCIVCGAWHPKTPCGECGQRAFHAAGCPEREV